VFAYLGDQIQPERIIESVFSTFKYINGENDNVGGTITLHVVSPLGIDAFEWRDNG
jgi:cystathionine beta-lyase/cystathionine gamma-synthase